MEPDHAAYGDAILLDRHDLRLLSHAPNPFTSHRTLLTLLLILVLLLSLGLHAIIRHQRTQLRHQAEAMGQLKEELHQRRLLPSADYWSKTTRIPTDVKPPDQIAEQ